MRSGCPLAYLLGLEGIALLDAWAGDHDRAFTEARLAEIRRLLDDEQMRDRGVLVEQVSTATVYEQASAGYDAEDVRHRRAGRSWVPRQPEPGVALDAACRTVRGLPLRERREQAQGPLRAQTVSLSMRIGAVADPGERPAGSTVRATQSPAARPVAMTGLVMPWSGDGSTPVGRSPAGPISHSW